MPDYTLVLKTFTSYRKMTPDDIALFETLCAMTDHQRELLVESLGPPVKVKAVKRKIEHCIAAKDDPSHEPCGLTRRAAHHRDTNHKDYHEFQPSSSKSKSARASSLAEKITGTAGSSKPPLCDFEIDGKVCKGTESDGIHDATMGYAAYHEFQPPVAAAATGD